MSEGLAVELLGRFRVERRRATDRGHPHARLESLVAYLLMHCDRPVAREQLAFTLWPESSDAQALTNLRRELHLLRRALPIPTASSCSSTGTVQWRPDGPFRFDVADFEAAVERGRAGDPRRLRGGAPACTTDPSCRRAMTTGSGPTASGSSGLQLEASERLVADLESGASIAVRCSSCAG